MENILPIAGCILAGIAIFLGVGFLIKLLWNWLLPNISGIKKVTYVQALGILILARLLFGGFGHGGHGWGGHGWGRHWNNNNSHCSWKSGGCNNQVEPGKKMENTPE